MSIVNSITFQPHPACKNFNDLTGQTFNSLSVLGYAGSDKWWNGIWYCQCICGNVTTVATGDLTGLHTRTCGCSRVKHGHAKIGSPEYSSWECMNQRCNNPNTHRYDLYGGRGITICARWGGEQGFENFLADMGEKPSPQHSLDRFPNKNGNYEPSNCRWAIQADQNRNRSNNHNITFRDETLCITDWAQRLGMSVRGLKHRLKHWDLERALTTPVDSRYIRRPHMSAHP